MKASPDFTRRMPICVAFVRATLLMLGGVVLAACGSGGGASSGSLANGAPVATSSGTPAQACNGCGAAIVSLTDAPGDFLSYVVNVVSLQLTRSDGTVVQAVPVTTKVDFAQLVNLAEIISTSQIPAGQYVSAAITLDYGGATIVVDNGGGGVTIAPGNIIDGATSAPLTAPNPTQMTLTVALTSNAPFDVKSGAVANLALDFNLAASNAVAPSPTIPTTVTVNPVLTATLVPDATKQLRVRGSLVSTSASGFVVNVLPFDNDHGDSGQITVQTTSATTFTINGVSLAGSAGLAQLASQSAGTMTAAYGSYDVTTGTFTAGSVLAGSSVAGTRLDSVTGTVVSRSGNNLMLADGMAMHAGLDDPSFAHEISATVGAATAVSEQGVPGTFTVQDISVGQRLQLSGHLATGGSGTVSLDATAGNALLMPTRLQGTVTALAPDLVTVNLQSLDGQAAAGLLFAGTGATSAQDASAASYAVSVPAALDIASLSIGTPVSFVGFVSPFGAAPPDFAASALADYGNTRAEFNVRWTAGITAPFASLTSSGLSVSQTALAASAAHFVEIAFERIDLSTLTGGVQLVPDAAATNTSFTIGHRSSWKGDSYSTFGDFVTALTADLNGTTAVLGVAASGPYDAAKGVLSVDKIVVMLND